jgi:hypothetical protein
MWDRSQGFGSEGQPDARPVGQVCRSHPAKLHAAVIKIAFSALAWFFAVTWLKVAEGAEVDPTLAVVAGLFVMAFTLVLVSASPVAYDPR